LKVYDSNLADPRNLGGPATFEIYDSTLNIIATYKGGQVYVENSSISEAIEVKDANSVIFGYNISGDYELLESDGGVFESLDSPGPPWD
jgi:hypothetical protein